LERAFKVRAASLIQTTIS
jgi:hypothetical protein